MEILLPFVPLPPLRLNQAFENTNSGPGQVNLGGLAGLGALLVAYTWILYWLAARRGARIAVRWMHDNPPASEKQKALLLLRLCEAGEPTPAPANFEQLTRAQARLQIDRLKAAQRL